MTVYVEILALLGTIVVSTLAGFWGAGKALGQYVERLNSQDRLIADFKLEFRELREENREMSVKLGEVRGQLLRMNGGKSHG